MVSTRRTIAFINANRNLPDDTAQRAALEGRADLVISSSNRGYQRALAELNEELKPGDALILFSTTVFEVSTPVFLKMIEDLLKTGISINVIEPSLHLTPSDLDQEMGILLTALVKHSAYYHRLKTQKGAETRARSGRQPKLAPSQLAEVRKLMSAPGANATSVAKTMNVSRATLFNFLRKHRQEGSQG